MSDWQGNLNTSAMSILWSPLKVHISVLLYVSVAVKAYMVHATVAILVIPLLTFTSHVSKYPTRCNTPYTTSTLWSFAKHHRMIRRLAHAISAVNLAWGLLFTTVPFAKFTFISSVFHYRSPLKLKFTTTNWSHSGSSSRLFVIFVVKKARACPTYVVAIVDFGPTLIVLPYHAWSNVCAISTLSSSLTLLRTIILSTEFANFAWNI